jgi:hypothetical protein
VTFTRIVVLALALTHAVGIAELVRRAACEAECADDGCDDCGPNETGCACHCPAAPQVMNTGTVAVVAIARTTSAITVAPRDRTHASPDPREILHVPRQLG